MLLSALFLSAALGASAPCPVMDGSFVLSSLYDFSSNSSLLQGFSDASDPRLVSLLRLYDSESSKQDDLLTECMLLVAVFHGCPHDSDLLSQLGSVVAQLDSAKYAEIKRTRSAEVDELAHRAYTLWVSDFSLPFCPSIAEYASRLYDQAHSHDPLHPQDAELPWNDPSSFNSQAALNPYENQNLQPYSEAQTNLQEDETTRFFRGTRISDWIDFTVTGSVPYIPYSLFSSGKILHKSSFVADLPPAPASKKEKEDRQMANRKDFKLSLKGVTIPEGISFKKSVTFATESAVSNRQLSISSLYSFNPIAIKDANFSPKDDPRFYALSFLYGFLNLGELEEPQKSSLTEWSLIVSVFQKAFRGNYSLGRSISAICRIFVYLVENEEIAKMIGAYEEMTADYRPQIEKLVDHALTLWETDKGLPACPTVEAFRKSFATKSRDNPSHEEPKKKKKTGRKRRRSRED